MEKTLNQLGIFKFSFRFARNDRKGITIWLGLYYEFFPEKSAESDWQSQLKILN